MPAVALSSLRSCLSESGASSYREGIPLRLWVAALTILVTPVCPSAGADRGSLADAVARLGWIFYSARAESGDWDIFACRPDGSSVRNLTRTSGHSEGYPVLSPDGRRMLYRRIRPGEAFDGNNYGAQGEAVVAGTDGSGARVLGQAGQFPWACWSADASRLVCLSASGIAVFDEASLTRTQELDRKGFFQQIAVSPDGGSLVGVANGFGATWSVGRYQLADNAVNAVSVGESCTPNWCPDGRSIVFSHKPPGQKGNGGYGWTQLWAGAPDGSSRRLLFAEEARHVYGGHVSPDGQFVVFTGNQKEDGDAGHRGARMSVMRLADAPIIIGNCPEARLLCPQAKSGPVLDLPDGWEPWWTSSPPSPLPARERRDPADGRPESTGDASVGAEIEVTARLLEIPHGAIRDDPLYRYAAVLKYQILRIHRGAGIEPVIFVAHYQPQYPRAKAADRFRADVVGSLAAFHAGDVHRMVLAPNAEQKFIGGVINNYLEARDVFWALRTDLSDDHAWGQTNDPPRQPGCDQP